MCSHISKEYVVIGWDASGKKKKTLITSSKED